MIYMTQLMAVLMVSLLSHACSTDPLPSACNGHASLCDLRLDQITLAGSHNGMSNADDGWEPPNHLHGIEQQLADGIRVLGLDVQIHDEEVKLCHSLCQLGERLLSDALTAIRTFLENNPQEILVISLQDDTGDPEALAQSFLDAGMKKFALAQSVGQPWPTLANMIQKNKRLIIFGKTYPGHDWMLTYNDFVWVTDYATPTTDSQTCEARSGYTATPTLLFDLHHSLVDPLPTETNAAISNDFDYLMQRAKRCEVETGQRPNFIDVDFYSIGDIIPVVNALNGVGDD